MTENFTGDSTYMLKEFNLTLKRIDLAKTTSNLHSSISFGQIKKNEC